MSFHLLSTDFGSSGCCAGQGWCRSKRCSGSCFCFREEHGASHIRTVPLSKKDTYSCEGTFQMPQDHPNRCSRTRKMGGRCSIWETLLFIFVVGRHGRDGWIQVGSGRLVVIDNDIQSEFQLATKLRPCHNDHVFKGTSRARNRSVETIAISYKPSDKP